MSSWSAAKIITTGKGWVCLCHLSLSTSSEIMDCATAKISPCLVITLIVQGLCNDLNKGLNIDEGIFNVILGDDSKKVDGMIHERFGRDPSGRMVDWLNRNDLM